ncbi:MBL fold metallo-hydrolase [Yoonia sp. 2307UL14-13]|uniref:MBL fold metallo-hydrolase n=1 Tax=Yoonia sp. 2307UL14-13 TaxID=3126506 RepID=UPI00309F1E93
MSAPVSAFSPQTGVPLQLAPDLQLILAPNPSPMTYLGTNTYLVGHDDLMVIDPGPDDPAHLAALISAIGGRNVTHILITHSHLDHTPLARPLAQRVDAPICAFGDSRAGRSAVMQDLAIAGLAGGGEGVDMAFRPDVILTDGAVIDNEALRLTAIHTPGHMGNHLCFVRDNTVFTGDHVMGWSSSLVSPPDGDLTDFMASCHKLSAITAKRYYPGHGAPIDDPKGRLTWLIGHRQQREVQIVAALGAGPLDVGELTRAVYADLAPGLLIAAERNIFAHLVDLVARGIVAAVPELRLTARFQQVGDLETSNLL